MYIYLEPTPKIYEDMSPSKARKKQAVPDIAWASAKYGMLEKGI